MTSYLLFLLSALELEPLVESFKMSKIAKTFAFFTLILIYFWCDVIFGTLFSHKFDFSCKECMEWWWWLQQRRNWWSLLLKPFSMALPLSLLFLPLPISELVCRVQRVIMAHQIYFIPNSICSILLNSKVKRQYIYYIVVLCLLE